MEYLNLYDKQGNLVNKKGIRGQKSDYLVGIVIIFIENSKGEFLIQKTSEKRGNIFATTGGHVSYGSNFYDSVIIEVKEELGIDISNKEFTEVATYIKEYYVQKVYYLKMDININEVIIQKDEVDFVKWLSKEEIFNLIENNEFREGNINGFKKVLESKI